METIKTFKNKEVKKFFESSIQIYNKAILDVQDNFNKKIERWKTLQFTKFDCENPFDGELKNTIFIYNHDHYCGNGSTWCSAENLIHPHTNMEDRGYIKGIAVDLTNYLILKDLHGGFSFGHEFFYLYGNYSTNKRPSFNKSKNYESKMDELKMVDSYFENKKNELLADLRKKEDEFLKEFTGLSLNYYNIKF
jgi:hypothetical protein